MAKLMEFVDPDGQKIKLLTVNDAIVSNMPGLEQNFGKLQEFKFRDDDVILTAYPRSGTHFVWEIIHMLRRGTSEYVKGEKEADFLELICINGVDKKEDRVVNTHLTPELLPVDYKNRKCKFIHVFRNPKDALVSQYNHLMNYKSYHGYDGKFSGFLELAMKGHVICGKWTDYELKYEKFFTSNPDIPSLILCFEDLKKDPVSNITKVSDFLGRPRDDKLIASIEDAVTFSKMKAGKMNLSTDFLKHSNDNYNKMYRKGEAGDWKNWFTVAQNEHFDAQFNKAMKNSALLSKIKWEM